MAPLKRFSDIINELSMKSDKKLPNLKEPVKGKKGISKFMRMKIHNAPYTSDYKKAMNADVHSADRKPEKYIKPDGKVGIRMVKVDKEIIKKESVGKTAGDKSYYHLQRAKELAKKDGHDYDKLPQYDRTSNKHKDHYHDMAKKESVKKESTMSFREKLVSLYEGDRASHYKGATKPEEYDEKQKSSKGAMDMS